MFVSPHSERVVSVLQGGAQAAQEQQDRARQEQEFKDTLLSQCLDQAARARCMPLCVHVLIFVCLLFE